MDTNKSREHYSGVTFISVIIFTILLIAGYLIYKDMQKQANDLEVKKSEMLSACEKQRDDAITNIKTNGTYYTLSTINEAKAPTYETKEAIKTATTDYDNCVNRVNAIR